MKVDCGKQLNAVMNFICMIIIITIDVIIQTYQIYIFHNHSTE